MPRWFIVLCAAETWHAPPWELEAAPRSALWIARWLEVQRIKAKIAELP